MSTMKLQKLCYYSQAWSLVWDEAPLFNEDFEAWANGPVCPVLFKQTKGKYAVTAEDEPVGEVDLTGDQKKTIDAVLAHYNKYDAQYLSALSHLEDPWKLTRGDLPAGAPSNKVIEKDDIARYYSGL